MLIPSLKACVHLNDSNADGTRYGCRYSLSVLDIHISARPAMGIIVTAQASRFLEQKFTSLLQGIDFDLRHVVSCLTGHRISHDGITLILSSHSMHVT
jgi:hypothetical protein